ncbi:hypothetical protein DPMN_087825, partial [Dreissena polymorpha]
MKREQQHAAIQKHEDLSKIPKQNFDENSMVAEDEDLTGNCDDILVDRLLNILENTTAGNGSSDTESDSDSDDGEAELLSQPQTWAYGLLTVVSSLITGDVEGVMTVFLIDILESMATGEACVQIRTFASLEGSSSLEDEYVAISTFGQEKDCQACRDKTSWEKYNNLLYTQTYGIHGVYEIVLAEEQRTVKPGENIAVGCKVKPGPMGQRIS